VGASKYAAFVSYSHKDEAVARWLHRKLERYTIPRGAAQGYGRAGLFGRHIGRIFRDREELPAGYPLSETINAALADSDALIVLCSPNAARSEYVNKEIVEFRRLGKGNRIFPVIVSGEDHEVFPPALSGKREILEADLRSDKDGKHQVVVKLVAGLMGLEPNDLTKREARAQRRRLIMASTGAIAFAAVASLAIWFAYLSNLKTAEVQSTFNRLFATNGQQAFERGELFLAVRYALAGRRLSPNDSPDYDVVLASAYAEIGSHQVFETGIWGLKSVALSPDGSRIVTAASYDDNLRLWDAATGRQIGAPLKGHDGEVYSVAFSPDGRKIVSGSSDATIRLWDAATGRQIGAPLTGHWGTISSVAFSPDGSRIVSGGNDATIRKWDASTGQQIGASITGHKGLISSVVFSPDGRRIVSGCKDDPLAAGVHDATIRLWDASTGRQIGAPITGHEDGVTSVAFSFDGSRIVSGGENGTIRLWDAASGRAIGAPLKGDKGWIRSVAFSPDGRRIISGSSN